MYLFRWSVLLLLAFFALCSTAAQAMGGAFEVASPFIQSIDDKAIQWGYISVPENWDDPRSRKIRLGTVIIKNKAGNEQAEAVVYIPGGPGGSGIASIRFWLNHPLRANHDIILTDLRGTGFSEPRLCENLGRQLFHILAADQNAAADEREKVNAAIACKTDLEARDIDPEAYNSRAIARDLHWLKTQLGYAKWSVFGVSYGTFVAQVYTQSFPDEVSRLILDSPISDISRYYTHNTSGYMQSLYQVFDRCEQDPKCNENYPRLKEIYHQTIRDLRSSPITVHVDLPELDDSTFTYNEQDFKVTVQQALYNKKLIEVVPLLIYQFHDRSKGPLTALVAAFSGAFSLDYGAYYCMSCDEALPLNNLDEYENDAAQYPDMKGGISFYKTDFAVCHKWNQLRKDSVAPASQLRPLQSLQMPILIFSGEFDPITPRENGEMLHQRLANSKFILAEHLGHGPSFSPIGRQIVLNFMLGKDAEVGNEGYQALTLDFADNITIKEGISSLAANISTPNLIFLGPLLIACCILIVASLNFLYRLISNAYPSVTDRLSRMLIILASVMLIAYFIYLVVGIQDTANRNFYILAFGLPAEYDVVFLIFKICFGLSFLMVGLLLMRAKSISNVIKVTAVTFSYVLILTYLFYWHLIL